MCTPARPLEIKTVVRDGVVVCQLVGSATMETCQELNERLTEISRQEVGGLVIDLAELDFICSLGLGSLVAAYLRAQRAGVLLRLVAPRPAVMEVLEITKLHTLLPVYDSVEQALAGVTVL